MTCSHVYLIDSDMERRATLAQGFDAKRHHLQMFDDVAGFIDWIDYSNVPEAACVVTHLDLAPLNGIDLLRILRADQVTLPAVLMGTIDHLSLAVQAPRYGYACTLWRPVSAAIVTQAVQSVLFEWNATAPAAVSQECVEQRFASLSRRQRQVLHYVFEGNCNRAIADALGISVKTVELHRACLMKKMCADSLVDLIKMAARFREALGHTA